MIDLSFYAGKSFIIFQFSDYENGESGHRISSKTNLQGEKEQFTFQLRTIMEPNANYPSHMTGVCTTGNFLRREVPGTTVSFDFTSFISPMCFTTA